LSFRILWAVCGLRNYLNRDFYSDFTAAGRAQIAEMVLTNPKRRETASSLL
jgi:hypothetical protein